jgi:hypothetical protein
MLGKADNLFSGTDTFLVLKGLGSKIQLVAVGILATIIGLLPGFD